MFIVFQSILSLHLTFNLPYFNSSEALNQALSKPEYSDFLTLHTKLIVQENLEEIAQQLYEQRKFDQAIPVLQQVIEQAKITGHQKMRARAWRNLALVYLEQQQIKKAEEAINTCLFILKNSQETQDDQLSFASSLEVKGQIQLLKGQPEQALLTWKEANKIYQKIDNLTGWIRSKINQVQALQALGLYSQGLKILTEMEQLLQLQSDTAVKVKALQSLGDILREVGQLERSQMVLQQSLTLAETLNISEAIAKSLMSLGHTAKLKNQLDAASNYYQQVIKFSNLPLLKIQGLTNQFNVWIEQEKFTQATDLLPEIEALLTQQPLSLDIIQARIHLAQNLIHLRELEKSAISALQIATQLKGVIQESILLENQQLESYGFGMLGHLYEQNKQWNEAKDLTEKALILAHAINAPDVAYQWQWQLGRILVIQNNHQEAILAYSQAVKNLQTIRSDIVAIGSNIQFDFREKVEPVYRELVGLLLESQPSQENLIKARNVIESLQLAELDNFLRSACLDVKSVDIDQIDSTAAVFYTIILQDRLEVILALPEQPLIHYTTQIEQSQVEAKLKSLVEAVTIPKERIFIENFLEPSEEIYHWLIHPIEKQLKDRKIETLVFVLDGSLRNIPVAGLYDGQKFLVEKYGIAIAPSLQLIDPKPLALQNIEVLSGGLSEARQGFSALPGVVNELKQIKEQVQGQILLNQSFTESNFNTEILSKSYSIVHLATHGEFSSKVEETFILTWDERINIEELRTLLNVESQKIHPIELLVLSACQTAAGDQRAGLGLAGVALRSGARSTLASLWAVDDESTALLMTYFYQELNQNGVTKAQALHQAQQKILQQQKFAHPYFWSAFVLVGNWL